jgi:hypothetical protein
MSGYAAFLGGSGHLPGIKRPPEDTKFREFLNAIAFGCTKFLEECPRVQSFLKKISLFLDRVSIFIFK